MGSDGFVWAGRRVCIGISSLIGFRLTSFRHFDQKSSPTGSIPRRPVQT